MSVLTQIVQNMHSFCLCLKSAPGSFMSTERNAEYHLKHVCPHCNTTRRKTRDVEGCGDCWWASNWLQGNYEIPRTFGLFNYVRASFNMPTKLEKFREAYSSSE